MILGEGVERSKTRRFLVSTSVSTCYHYDLCDYKSLPWVVLVTVSSIYVFSESCVLPAGKELLLDKRRLNLCQTSSLHLNRTLFLKNGVLVSDMEPLFLNYDGWNVAYELTEFSAYFFFSINAFIFYDVYRFGKEVEAGHCSWKMRVQYCLKPGAPVSLTSNIQ